MRRKITVSGDYLSLLSCYARGVERLPYRPLFLIIEPTNACNLKCMMCPLSGKHFERFAAFVGSTIKAGQS